MQEFVAVLTYPGCISLEVALAAELLSQRFRIVNATPDGRDVDGNSGLPLKAQASYASLNLENCRAILVPGGDPGCLVGNRDVISVLQEADRRRLYIAAICAGPSVLGMAGILKGRRIAHGYGPEQLEFLKEIFTEVQLSDEVFVEDGHILTAKPQAHIQFGVELAARLGIGDPATTTKRIDYYRGT